MNIHSGYEEEDGNTAMRDAHEDLQVRHTPPTTQDNNRRVRWHDEDHIHITVWKDRKLRKREIEENRPMRRDRTPPKREMEETGQDETSRSWFKITVPCGRKYNKTWLLDSIQSHCSVPFTPVDFHYVRTQAQFFVQDVSTASALKNVNYKIRDDENQKIRIFVSHSTVPYSVQNKLKPEQMEQLKLTMNKRYDVFQQALDLQSFRFEPDLVDHDIDMILNRRNCMDATLKIIEENFPELLSLNLSSNKLYQLDGLSDIIQKAPKVKTLNLSDNELKSAWELNKIRELKLEELWLEGNPLCNNFSNQSTYVSLHSPVSPLPTCTPIPPSPPPCHPLPPEPASLIFLPGIGSHPWGCPGLVQGQAWESTGHLDGQQLLPSLTVEIKVADIMTPSKESYRGSETLKNLVLQFLQQYYWIYDYGDRQGLLVVYHNEACFSLTIPFNAEDPAPISLGKYSKGNRNLKKRKDPVLRVQLLKHTKRDVVNFLSVLPKTQHDLSSFVVDMCVQTEKMLCFSLNGVFKEVEGVCQAHVRAFTRIFIATPASNSGLYIVNDQLCVRDASPIETQGAFFTLVPTDSSSSVPTLSQEQQEMVQVFSTQSGMKFEWSLKCLEDNEWNYNRAGQIFTTLKVRSEYQVGERCMFLGIQEGQEGGGKAEATPMTWDGGQADQEAEGYL
ncbi:nuclear RNA export factor 2-like [Dugong dugon]